MFIFITFRNHWQKILMLLHIYKCRRFRKLNHKWALELGLPAEWQHSKVSRRNVTRTRKTKKTVTINEMLYYFYNIHWGQERTEGGVGVKPPLSFLFCKKLLNFAWEVICFRILFACYFVDLMEIPRNKFACKFQGTLWTGQRVIIMFWWESGLSSASRNHLTTFCRSFIYYAHLRLCSAMVYSIRNSCLYFVC